MGRLLDKYDQMQRRPLGTNTMLNDGTQKGIGGAVGSQYRKQGAAYGRALRILNRQARRGDARSAMAAIDVRGQAMDEGYTPGGIRNKAQADAGILGRVNQLDRSARDIQRVNDNNTRDAQEARAPLVNPNATAGAGRGQPLSPRNTTTAPAPGSDAARQVALEKNQRSGNYATADTGDGGMAAAVAMEDRNRRENAPVVIDRRVGEPPSEADYTKPTRITAKADGKKKRESMINGRPASEVIAEMQKKADAGDPAAQALEAQMVGVPKAKRLSKVKEYLANVEKYQAGLSSGNTGYKDADAAATEVYQSGTDLEKAKMTAALMRRAAGLDPKSAPVKSGNYEVGDVGPSGGRVVGVRRAPSRILNRNNRRKTR